MMGRYNGMLTKAFNDQLQLIIKDRAWFTPWDHETIYDFQKKFEKK